MDIGGWLRSLGLGEYEAIFRENKIDETVLPKLTADDLKELGVRALGDRRKLLDAIAGLDAYAHPRLAALATAALPRDTAERRQVTVMFSDLVGSTALSARMDPEDLREVMSAYQKCVAKTVQRFGGFVAKYMGDGVLIYFGYPQAHEDDAEGAVRAGLELIQAVSSLNSSTPLQTRVGIATGLVVIGDLIGSGEAQERGIVGETPNVAARLQSVAEPNTVVIAESTRKLLGNLFDLQDIGAQDLKGIADHVRAWSVLRASSVESRFEALRTATTPLVGRHEETELLMQRWAQAKAGDGYVVLISGEPGIGKSRIAQTIQERLSKEPHTRLRFFCSPYHQDSTLYPAIAQLERAAGFRREDTAQQRLTKLEALLAQATNEISDIAPLIADLLSIPTGDRYPPLTLTPQKREEKTLLALVAQAKGLVVRHPVLMIFEDVHWSDPTTLELLDLLVEWAPTVQLLLIITFRPEFSPPWVGRPQVTLVTLNRLPPRERADMIDRMMGRNTLPREITEQIIARTDGVPLFIEELTRCMIETDGAFGDSGVPETLQASLLARLDRLGSEAKEVAQIAAVIGREFSSKLVSAVAGKSGDALAPALERLVASHIALPSGDGQGSAYTFRHALIQDAAYQSLLLSRRRQYHSEIAHALEGRFSEIAEDQPEVTAQHFTAAAAPELAIPYWVKAGERALARSVYLEPLAHFEQALQLARGLPESPSRLRLVLTLLLMVGEARLRVVRLQEALQSFTEAAELARALGSPADLARAALGAEESAVNMDIPVPGCARLLEVALGALDESDKALRGRVLSHLGRVMFKLGTFDRASALMREAVDVARSLGDRRALSEALDCAHIVTAGQPWAARQFPARRAGLDEMMAVAEEFADGAALMRSLAFAMTAHLEMGDLDAWEAGVARYRATAEKGELTLNWVLNSFYTMQAILHGNFAAAERFAEGALEVRGDVDDDVISGVYGMQMFTIRREQGRLAEVAPLVRRFVAEKLRDGAWRPGLALIAVDLGFTQAAQKTFIETAAEGFNIPVDAKRNITLSYLAEICTRLADDERAQRLYDLLLPYRDLAVVVPVATVCCGANARYLGMLATVLGEWAAAEAHFEAALAMDERLQAWPWLAHTKHEFALMLRKRGRAGDRERADSLLATASASAERYGMAALQSKIRSLATQS